MKKIIQKTILGAFLGLIGSSLLADAPKLPIPVRPLTMGLLYEKELFKEKIEHPSLIRFIEECEVVLLTDDMSLEQVKKIISGMFDSYQMPERQWASDKTILDIVFKNLCYFQAMIKTIFIKLKHTEQYELVSKTFATYCFDVSFDQVTVEQQNYIHDAILLMFERIKKIQSALLEKAEIRLCYSDYIDAKTIPKISSMECLEEYKNTSYATLHKTSSLMLITNAMLFHVFVLLHPDLALCVEKLYKAFISNDTEENREKAVRNVLNKYPVLSQEYIARKITLVDLLLMEYNLLASANSDIQECFYECDEGTDPDIVCQKLYQAAEMQKVQRDLIVLLKKIGLKQLVPDHKRFKVHRAILSSLLHGSMITPCYAFSKNNGERWFNYLLKEPPKGFSQKILLKFKTWVESKAFRYHCNQVIQNMNFIDILACKSLGGWFFI